MGNQNATLYISARIGKKRQETPGLEKKIAFFTMMTHLALELHIPNHPSSTIAR